MNSTFTSYLTLNTTTINERLDTLIPQNSSPHPHLYEAARYSLLSPGKRIRPLLCLATLEALGHDPSIALDAACALEFVHAYSMIHDDLPCMDDDDYRRGRLTLHKVYNEGHAVLTGDYLLTRAFEIICQASSLNETQKIELVALLAKGSGGEGMIGGQVMDITNEGQPIDFETLKVIHEKKTGALLTTAIEFGAVIANCGEKQREVLRHCGNQIGLAFQIVDDVIDVVSSEQKHGKKQSSDEINGKATYVTLLGIEGARQAAADHYASAKAGLLEIGIEENSPLHSIAELMITRKY